MKKQEKKMKHSQNAPVKAETHPQSKYCYKCGKVLGKDKIESDGYYYCSFKCLSFGS